MYLYEVTSLRLIDITSEIKSIDWIVVDFLYYGFIVASCFFAMLIYWIGFKFEFYTTDLIIQYIFLVLYAFSRLKNNTSLFKALSLSFLIVFLNSYLWEIVLHVAEYNINIMKLFNFRELIHLIVIPFILSHYQIELKEELVYRIKMLLFINFLFSIINIEVFGRWLLLDIPFFVSGINMFNFFNRLVSLILVIDMFLHCFKERVIKTWWFS